MSRSVESLQRELAQHGKNLDKLEERKAQYGLDVPLDVLNAIEEEKAAIARLEALLAGREPPAAVPSPAAPAPPPRSRIDTGGGAFIGGNVTVGGEFVGRDKVVLGDEVHGDKVLGDKVGGDKITVGDVSGTGVAIGREARATVTQGLGGDDIAKLFASVYRRIEARPEDPDVDKAELTETVQKIEREVSKGEQANPKKVERWLRTLALMAEDIFEVTAACLTSPAAGIATVIRKVVDKAKEEAAPARS